MQDNPSIGAPHAIAAEDPYRVTSSAARRDRLRELTVALVLVAVAIVAFWSLDVSLQAIWNGVGKLGEFTVLMVPPDYGSSNRLTLYCMALGETLAIAFLGTLSAAVLAFLPALLAARNVMASRIVRFTSRRFFDTIRGVDTLIWALIWINVVGLGPFAGVLAILTSDFGTFGKLFSEAIETSDRRAVEGVRASGGSSLHEIRFGILPQVLPLMASQVLYYFESNTRSATIIGIVGAGGIGLHLSEQIRTLEWQAVSFLILMILVTVAIIDWLSGRLRIVITGKRPT
jgi:phosphonate transport system permease protein